VLLATPYFNLCPNFLFNLVQFRVAWIVLFDPTPQAVSLAINIDKIHWCALDVTTIFIALTPTMVLRHVLGKSSKQ